MDGLDVRAFKDLMEESADLQSDAMRTMRDPLDAIVDLGKERRSRREYRRAQRDRVDSGRRAMLGSIGALGALGSLGALGVSAAFAPAAMAAEGGEDADIMALQTAASLENLAVFTYKTALTLPYLMDDSTAIQTVGAFAKMTMQQHKEHGEAFNARAVELGGTEQTETHPKYTEAVQGMLPALMEGGPADVVALAITLEDVATSTYVQNIQDVEDAQVKLLFGTVAGVESQHLATLYAVAALLENDLANLITIKATGGATNAAKLPEMTAALAIPETFKLVELAEDPSSGAVQ